jgi:hypothetical protein
MNDSEVLHPQGYDIDPLKGITIEGVEYIGPQTATLEQVSLALGEPFFSDGSELAEKLNELLHNPTAFKNEFQPLGVYQQDASQDGTRTIKGVLKSFPDRIIVLTGCGVVRAEISETPSFTMEPPYWKESVDKHLDMGHMQIAADGTIWRKKNRSTFGAYETNDLKEKIQNTQELSGITNHDANLQVLLAGTHKGHEGFGWMAYSLPTQSMRITELLAVDLMQRKDNESKGLFGEFLGVLFQRMREMHEQKIIHLAFHPGNCYPVLHEDGRVDVAISDWETVQKTDRLPDSQELQKKSYKQHSPVWEGLSAEQVAKAVDIHVALESTLLLLHKRLKKTPAYKKEFGIDYSALALTKDVFSVELTNLSAAILGYLGQELSQSNLTDVKIVLTKLLKDHIVPEIGEEMPLMKGDWQSAGGDIDLMDRPNYLFSEAFRRLNQRIAGFLVSGETTFDVEGILAVKIAEREVEHTRWQQIRNVFRGIFLREKAN